jgi:hypothetical protein
MILRVVTTVFQVTYKLCFSVELKLLDFFCTYHTQLKAIYTSECFTVSERGPRCTAGIQNSRSKTIRIPCGVAKMA